MKEHAIGSYLFFSLLTLLSALHQAQASTAFTNLYRYEVNPEIGTNARDFGIDIGPAGGEGYTGDEGVGPLVRMNGYADGDSIRVKISDPDQAFVFDHEVTYDASSNCFIYETFHAPAGTSEVCPTGQYSGASVYSFTRAVKHGKTGTWSFEVTGNDSYRFSGSFELVGRTLEIVGSSHYSVEAQTSLSEPLQVRLLDYDGVTAVEGEPVSFTMIGTPGGAVGSASETQTTDAAGIARTFFDAGIVEGIYVIEATSPTAAGRC